MYADDVPDDVKRRRNNELLAVQNRISYEDNQAFLGRVVEILVEGPSERARRQEDHAHGDDQPEAGGEPNHDHVHGPLQLVGRTNCDRIVVFDGNPRQIGQILPVTVYDANSFTLFGEVVTEHVGPQMVSLSL